MGTDNGHVSAHLENMVVLHARKGVSNECALWTVRQALLPTGLQGLYSTLYDNKDLTVHLPEALEVCTSASCACACCKEPVW